MLKFAAHAKNIVITTISSEEPITLASVLIL
jgi:hypothetical protein